MRRLRKRWDREPNLRETVVIAIRQAQLSPAVFHRMRMRAMLAPILPKITFRYKFRYSHDEDEGETLSDADVRYYTQGAVDPDLYTVRILPRDQTSYTHEAYIFASWATDALIYSPQETKLTRILPRMSNERLKVVSKVVRTYHARRRLLTSAFSAQLQASVLSHQLLKLAELTAVLDAYTDGKFSRLAEERGAPVGEL
ncbi:MAG: hypothetical protein GY822_02355, partial [Deltaproteobacteria bacterium]|nr:hypothetical protein [Deltaproteobacteria bacterium]